MVWIAGVLVILAAPVVMVGIPYGIYAAIRKQTKKENEKIKARVAKENQAKVDEAKEKAKQMTESKSDSLTFYEFNIDGTPIEKPALMNLSVSQSAHVTPENSTIFKGRVRVKDLKEGKTIEKDLYFYFPDLYVGAKKIPIKPNLSTTGHLVDEAPYLIRNSKDGKYYTTIVPMAECYTGIEFDFIKDSKVGPNLSRIEKSQQKLSDYISVELVRDHVDDFVPVNFNDPMQKKAYEDYLAERRQKDAREPGSVFKEVQGLIIKAGESLGISKGENPEKYTLPLEKLTEAFKSSPDASRVVDSKKPQQQQQGGNYYDQFRYIPRGSNYYRMGLYGISNGSGSLNSSAKSDNPYEYYDQFRYIPEGSVLDRYLDGTLPRVPHGSSPAHPSNPPHGHGGPHGGPRR